MVCDDKKFNEITKHHPPQDAGINIAIWILYRRTKRSELVSCYIMFEWKGNNQLWGLLLQHSKNI